jgi:hypothetical protein
MILNNEINLNEITLNEITLNEMILNEYNSNYKLFLKVYYK